MASVFLLTGSPGTGKTTIIRETLSFIPVTMGGFYTQEILENGIRVGFKIITLDGKEAILSHINFKGMPMVGKYGVNLNNLESVGVVAIREALANCRLIVIDEIGKMELLSSSFQEAVLMSVNSDKYILGTIMYRSNYFADKIKKNPKVRLLTVTVSNRVEVLAEIISSLQEMFHENTY